MVVAEEGLTEVDVVGRDRQPVASLAVLAGGFNQIPRRQPPGRELPIELRPGLPEVFLQGWIILVYLLEQRAEKFVARNQVRLLQTSRFAVRRRKAEAAKDRVQALTRDFFDFDEAINRPAEPPVVSRKPGVSTLPSRRPSVERNKPASPSVQVEII